MPMYSYRREDGTTFDYRQKFSDEPLMVDPVTGQRVTRVMQAAGIIFKGSGFYVNDSKGATKTSLSTNSESTSTKPESKSNDAPKSESTSAKSESNGAPAKAETATAAPSKASSTAAD